MPNCTDMDNKTSWTYDCYEEKFRSLCSFNLDSSENEGYPGAVGADGILFDGDRGQKE